MLTSKVTSKGQVTIPAEVRGKLGIRAGDLLSYEFDHGAVRVSKLRAFDAGWHGSVGATLAEEWNSPEDDEAFAEIQR
jgi:AbrB family looped-hinge helix DNA binding protein